MLPASTDSVGWDLWTKTSERVPPTQYIQFNEEPDSGPPSLPGQRDHWPVCPPPPPGPVLFPCCLPKWFQVGRPIEPQLVTGWCTVWQLWLQGYHRWCCHLMVVTDSHSHLPGGYTLSRARHKTTARLHGLHNILARVSWLVSFNPGFTVTCAGLAGFHAFLPTPRIEPSHVCMNLTQRLKEQQEKKHPLLPRISWRYTGKKGNGLCLLCLEINFKLLSHLLSLLSGIWEIIFGCAHLPLVTGSTAQYIIDIDVKVKEKLSFQHS